jgi:hypothetical protein
LSIVGLIFGIFACIPAESFEERDIGICVSFITLTACGIVTTVSAGIGFCGGACVSACCCCDEEV